MTRFDNAPKDTTEIKQLEDEAQRLSDKLSAVRSRIVTARRALCPAQPGTVVLDRNGVEHLVRDITKEVFGWVSASPRKKDGTWSNLKRSLFDYYTPTKRKP